VKDLVHQSQTSAKPQTVMGKAIIFASDNHVTNNQKNKPMKMKTLLFITITSLVLTSASIAQNLPNYIPANGLIGWWPFNGNVNDESGNGYHGTLNGATLSNDRFGISSASYGFDGNAVVDFPSQNLNQNFTVSLWFNPDTLYILPCGQHEVFGNFTNNQSFPNGHIIGINELGQISVGNGIIGTPNTNNYQINNWLNAIYTYDFVTQTMSLYINNQLESTISGMAIVNYGTFFRAGARANTSPFCGFVGKMDDIGIWNRVLTQQEITALYNAVNCANNTTINPLTNSLLSGSIAAFTATTSDPNPSYVWQSDFGQGYVTLNNFGNYSGTNTSSLNIANVQLANHAQPIRVISTSGECIDTSNIATISILDTCVTSINDTTFITVTDTLVINTLITGINPPNNSNTIKVYPNPSNSHITIEYGDFAIMNGYQLRIENSLGQEVFQTNISQQSDYLNLNSWGGNGLYFVHIVDPQGNTIDIRKIVLQ
jgi:hypothetical protein